MRKLFPLLIVLMLVSTVRSADLLENFTDYRHLMRMNLGVDTTDVEYLPDTNANQFIRVAAVTIVPITQSNKAIFIDTTAYKKSAYDLDSAILGIIAVQWVKQDTIKTFNYLPMEQWNLPFNEQLSDGSEEFPKSRRPLVYEYIEGKLFLNPTPIMGGDTLRIIAWRKVLDIAVEDSLSTIPQQYRVPVLQYATWLAARSKQHPLTAMFKESYIEAIAIVGQSLNKRGASVSPSQ